MSFFKKNKTRDKDFILKGNPWSVLITLSVPLIISNLITVLYDLADGLWLAQLSPTAFAATGFTFPVIFFFISAALGLSIGGTTLISQSLGKGLNDRANSYAKHLLIIGLITGLLFSVIGYFSAPYIVGLMGATGVFYENSVTYLSLMALGFLLDSLIFCFQAILNSEGKTVRTTVIGLTSGLLNIVLDPFFIFATVPFIGTQGLDLGVAGAAIATFISKIASIIIGFIFIRDKNNIVQARFNGFKYNSRIVRRLMNMSIPTAIARSTTALGFTLSNVFIITLGEDVVTAFSLINRVNSIFMQIALGISAAMTAIIGQNIGAKLVDRAKAFIRNGFVFTIATGILGALFIYLFKTPIISLFVNPAENPSIAGHAFDYAGYSIVNIPVIGLFFVYTAIFQGMGHMKSALNLSIIRLWILRIPMLIFFIYIAKMGAQGVWLTMALGDTLVLAYGQYKYITDPVLFRNRKSRGQNA